MRVVIEAIKATTAKDVAGLCASASFAGFLLVVAGALCT